MTSTKFPTDRAGWQRVLETEFDLAARRLTAPDTELLPVFNIYADNNERHVFFVPIDTDKAEAEAYFLLAAAGVALRARGATHIAEAWARTVIQRTGETEAEVERRILEIQPRDAEDRREVVVATAVWRDKQWRPRILIGQREILRDIAGAPSLGPAAWSTTSEAPLCAVIPPRHVPPHVEIAAKQIFGKLQDAKLPQKH